MIAPILSLILFVLGSSYMITFVTVRLNLIDIPETTVGLIHSAYYAGLLIGSIKVEPWIARIGHIRAFTAFVGISIATIALQGLYLDPYWWMVLRFLAGFSLAALYVAIESWLLQASNSSTRWKFLAIYMVALYGSQSLSQFIIECCNIETAVPYLAGIVFCAVSIIPVCFSVHGSPQLADVPKVRFIEIYRASPLGYLGCIISGFMLSAIYSFSANFAQDNQINVSMFMSLTILGGLGLQYPLGKLSDMYDRRRVLFVMCISILIPCLLIMLLRGYPPVALALTFIIGGVSFAIYPIAIAMVCDQLEERFILAATTACLFAYGVGSVMGPIIVPWFIVLFSSTAIYAYLSITSITLGALSMQTVLSTPKMEVPEHNDFVALPRVSPVAHELDPRTTEPEESSELSPENST